MEQAAPFPALKQWITLHATVRQLMAVLKRAGLAVNLAAFDVRVDPQQLQGYMDQIEATGKKVLIEQAVRSTFTPARALPTWDVTFRAIETSTVESSTPSPAPPAPPAEEWAGAALPWELSS